VALFAYVRLKPYGDSTPEDRAKERYRRVALTILTSAGTRSITVLTLLISVRLTVNYLGNERYGMWVAIGSFVSILMFADLGIGNGLLSAIAESHGRNDRDAARWYVSSAFVILTGVALLLGIAFAAVYSRVSWERVYNVTSPSATAEAGPATVVFVASFLASIPLSIVQRIQRGYQEGYLDSLWIAVGKLIGLGAMLLVIALKGGLPWLVLALAGGPALALLVNNIVFFGSQRPWLRPHWRNVRFLYGLRIIRIGFLFFLLNLAGAVAYYSDPIILTQVLGPNSVTVYSVTSQLFRLSPLLLSLFLEPLWPAYGESLARGDVVWLRSTFRRSIVVGLVINVPYALALVFFGAPVIHVWVGDDVTPSRLMLLAFGVWSVIGQGLSQPIAMLLNGMQKVLFEVLCAVPMAAGNLLLSIYLTRHIGVSGVVWASVISQTVFLLIPSLFYFRQLLKPT
jgi:O-antigen/teichoic acid export membrane protein